MDEIKLIIEPQKTNYYWEIRKQKNDDYEILTQCYIIKCLKNEAYHWSWKDWAPQYLDISIRKYRAILRKFGADKLMYEKRWKNGKKSFKHRDFLCFKNKKDAKTAVVELEKYLIVQKLCSN